MIRVDPNHRGRLLQTLFTRLGAKSPGRGPADLHASVVDQMVIEVSQLLWAAFPPPQWSSFTLSLTTQVVLEIIGGTFFCTAVFFRFRSASRNCAATGLFAMPVVSQEHFVSKKELNPHERQRE